MSWFETLPIAGPLPPALPAPPVPPAAPSIPAPNPILPLNSTFLPDDTGYWFVDMKGFLGSAFAPSHPLWMHDPRAGNEVKILLNGQETYREMIKALDPYPKKWPMGSFIYLANWIVFDDFNLDRDAQYHLISTPRTTLRDVLKRASDKNVMIRALFWDRVFKSGHEHQNDGPRDFINSLRGGHAILDGRVINNLIRVPGPTIGLGSHHQKLLLVYGPEGLIAFAGGVDFHPDRVFGYRDPLDAPPGTSPSKIKRLDKETEKSAPLLDVHVRIRGPAAYDLLDVFLRRYADHPSAAGHDIYAPYRDYNPRADDAVSVRVCTTFGNDPARDPTNVTPTKHTLELLEGPQKERKGRQINVVTIKQDGGGRTRGVQPYSFAPRGRQSGRAQLLYAISGARKFIYFEDQYMVGQEIAQAIRDVVKRYGVKVIGVIPHQSISLDFDDKVTGWFRRDDGKNVLGSTRLSRVITIIYGKNADPQKVTFLFSPLQTQPGSQGSIYQYVHSKVFIVDDAFCTIGSMNFNRRSTTHDSELSLGFYEPRPRPDSLAKRLRLRLWQRHLGLPTSEQKLIDDPIDSIAKLWSQVAHFPSQIQSPGGTRWKPNVVRYMWFLDKPLGTSFVRLWSESEFVDSIADPTVTSDETKRLPSR